MYFTAFFQAHFVEITNTLLVVSKKLFEAYLMNIFELGYCCQKQAFQNVLQTNI